mgnify:CR=1 FL=1
MASGHTVMQRLASLAGGVPSDGGGSSASGRANKNEPRQRFPGSRRRKRCTIKRTAALTHAFRVQ